MDVRLRQIEAEMAKFEQEINSTGGRAPPPVPQMPAISMPPQLPPSAVSFIPHQLRHAGPHSLPPPLPPSMIPPLPPPSGFVIPAPGAPPVLRHALPTFIRPLHKDRIPNPIPPHLQHKPLPTVIEAPPTKYPLPSSVDDYGEGSASGKNSSNKRTEMSESVGSAITSQPPMPAVGPSSSLSSSTQSSSAPSSSSTINPRRFDALIQQDRQMLEQKRQQEAAYQNTYIAQVASGKQKPRHFLRHAAGETWEDQSLAEWDQNDFRMFCGDLGNEVSDELLAKAFRKYPSFQKAKVVRDKRTNKTKGYGFVSFKDPQDFIKAMREMNGRYVGNRPVKLRRSDWKDRDLKEVKKKTKQRIKLGLKA